MADAVICTLCELHAEAVFRVEGMDFREEVVILERRLKPLAGLAMRVKLVMFVAPSSAAACDIWPWALSPAA